MQHPSLSYQPMEDESPQHVVGTGQTGDTQQLTGMAASPVFPNLTQPKKTLPRKAIVIICSFEIAIGIIIMVCEIVLIGADGIVMKVGTGIWVGLFYVVAGAVGIVAAKKVNSDDGESAGNPNLPAYHTNVRSEKHRGYVVAFMVLSIIASIASAVLLIMCPIQLLINSFAYPGYRCHDDHSYHNDAYDYALANDPNATNFYRYDDHEDDSFCPLRLVFDILIVVMTILAGINGCLFITCAALCCRSVCCQRKPAAVVVCYVSDDPMQSGQMIQLPLGSVQPVRA
ncbi:PREDICTED: uncharacterized protein LOC106815044 [Priapulus caudatus]|uniref:Uncharacterized protein LOC106815044 n=1 Tax=Priapulus caudatus TaxID=37621 RepID=A0ABM1ERY3_PRICU|nr:PREDICTED: uncharacterized protein LOC106815044 [Priapulus caudatus]